MEVPTLMIRRILEHMIVVVRVILLLVEAVVEVIIKRDQEVTKMIEMLKDDQTMQRLRWKLIQKMNLPRINGRYSYLS